MKQKNLNSLLVAVIAIVFCFANAMAAPSNAKLPRLQKIGIIPVRWEDQKEEWKDFEKGQKILNQSYFAAVKESKRFRTLNDELVKQLWTTQRGRAELHEKYELDAFVNASVLKRGDIVDVTARLLGPEMQIYLQESESFDEDTIRSGNGVEASLKKLLFRMLNRLPYDVNVITVQGKYVTLAAGESQGVRNDDEFDVQQFQIESFHPANGSWLSFNSQKVGSVRVIDVKSQTSVAEIIDMTHDNAINPGDGIKVDQIKSRQEFHQNTVENPYSQPDEEGSPIVEPVRTDGTKTVKEKKPATVVPTKKPKLEVAEPPVKEEQKEEVDAPAPPPEEEAPEEPSDGKSFIEGIKESTKDMADTYSIYAGFLGFDASGAASGSSKRPLWLISNVGVRWYRLLMPQVKSEFGAGLLLGGNFYGYEFFGKAYWEQMLGDMPQEFNRIYFGGYSKLEGKNVQREDYGGGDALKIGLLIGVGGSLGKDLVPEKINWAGEISMPFYAMGNVGYSGAKHSLKGDGGLHYHLEAMLDKPIDDIRWGASFDYGTEKLKASDTVSEKTMKFLVLANMKW